MSTTTRRDFLKASSAVATLAGVSFTAGTLNALENPSIKGKKGFFVRSYCEMCSSRCQIEAKVVDKKNVFIQGNKYSKSMGGSVCARGGSGHSQLYDKQRLVTPLIRVAERGENKWKKATWDEALDYIALKMNTIKKEHGAKSFVFSSKTGDSHKHITTFASVFGSPNVFSHLSTCPISYKVAFKHTFGTGLKTDYSKSKYILNFGHNLFEGINIARTKSLSKQTLGDNQKLVVLDPRFSITASKADEWHPVKPGTDLAFVLSLIHIWIRDGKYDKKFVADYTIGIEELTKSTSTTTPQWQEQITGIKASVAERVADELYKSAPHCIIDWGHKTTTSKAEYQRTRAILVANAMMGNIEKEGGIYFAKKAKTVNKLAGSKIADVISNPDKHIKGSSKTRIDMAGMSGRDNVFVPKNHGVLSDIPKTILSDKPYPVKGWFMIRTNPVMTIADTQRTIKAIKILDFVVAVDIYMSDSAMLADVVLPESTYLERDDMIVDKSGKSPAYMIRNKVVEPINNTLSSSEIFRSLAKRMKIDSQYAWSNTLEYRVRQSNDNIDLLKTLVEKGYVPSGVPSLLAREEKYVNNFVKKYPKSKKHLNKDGHFDSFLKNLKTKSGKIEIFSQTVEDEFKGFGVPAFDDVNVQGDYKYILMSGKTAIHTNAHTHNVPYLHMLMSDNPVWINPQTAKKENLKDGDKIYLQNNIGKEKATVLVTEGIRPDTLFVYFGFGAESKALKRSSGTGTNQSKLLPPIKGKICSTMVTNVGVDIVKI